jgi:hypothetical protein
VTCHMRRGEGEEEEEEEGEEEEQDQKRNRSDKCRTVAAVLDFPLLSCTRACVHAVACARVLEYAHKHAGRHRIRTCRAG